ncbi:DUF4373 domain-containing protein [Tetragenococcus halophilus]|uniref:DUF4373 domain-containing protein n=1 Tax=Tetragenococcus halophilus TaxID=51669 RepID=A0A3G5FIM8_TETHA|nr:Lin1244/Lin1753 domain-containing protein [Tetragenococcus halophilus]AYW50207.1 DUF4373 domain-containing protein [Tetragenococcus halophilus]GBD63801.1 hypothetical protein TEHD23766T_1228 [Tetragenococcus halophilus subsp. flandriensis]
MNNYFPHDSNARNSDKLIPVRMKYGAEGYGIYFMILERLRDENNYMSVVDYNVIAFDLRVDTSKVKDIVENFGLFAFTEKGECFYSESFNKRMEIKDDKSKKRSEAGKKGAEKRWGNGKDSKNNGNAIAKPYKNDSKESKGKETKLKETKVSSSEQAGDDSILNSVQSFQQLWNFPNMVQQNTLMEFIDLYGDGLVDAAIKVAGSKDVNKSKSIAFIESCLKEWSDANVKTIEQAREYQRTRNTKRQSNYQSQPTRKEELPNWAKDDYEQSQEQEDPEVLAEVERKRQEYLKGAK